MNMAWTPKDKGQNDLHVLYHDTPWLSLQQAGLSVFLPSLTQVYRSILAAPGSTSRVI